MKIKKLILAICFILPFSMLFAQKANENFCGYWSLEGFQTKMAIFERADKLDIIVIDWAYCEELETLKIDIVFEVKLIISKHVPSNNYNTKSDLEIISSDQLKETITGDAQTVVYWNRIK